MCLVCLCVYVGCVKVLIVEAVSFQRTLMKKKTEVSLKVRKFLSAESLPILSGEATHRNFLIKGVMPCQFRLMSLFCYFLSKKNNNNFGNSRRNVQTDYQLPIRDPPPLNSKHPLICNICLYMYTHIQRPMTRQESGANRMDILFLFIAFKFNNVLIQAYQSVAVFRVSLLCIFSSLFLLSTTGVITVRQVVQLPQRGKRCLHIAHISPPPILPPSQTRPSSRK